MILLTNSSSTKDFLYFCIKQRRLNSRKKHKILFISSWFPNKLEPTNGNFVQRHAETVALLHEVEILHAIGDFHQKKRFLFDDQIINGIRTLVVYYRNSRIPLLNFIRRMKAYRLGYKRMQKPDLVHGNVLNNNMLFAVYLKRKYKIPFVVSEHWSALQEINHYKLSKLGKLIVKKIANSAVMIMPVTENLSFGIRKLGVTTSMKIIGNVVDKDLFTIGNKARDKFIFLHVSSLIPLKNTDKIINAAVQIHLTNPNFELHIGGDGDVNKLKAFIKKYNAEDYIKTFGMILSEEVSKKMRDANCFVLFSDYENQPCVILESFATGIPVIAPKVGGISEILNSERGILIEKGNEKELLKAMKNVLEGKTVFADPEEIRNYCVEHFSQLKIAEKFSDIYQSILNP